LGALVAQQVRIPIIGIGAGAGVDGQVLVMHDLLGITKNFSPRFLRRYLDLHSAILNATKQYIQDVKQLDFPNNEEQY
jgi:3-methyl-2-oxobutanoate hydroxymethyltransferase